jgi:hypothetical protein
LKTYKFPLSKWLRSEKKYLRRKKIGYAGNCERLRSHFYTLAHFWYQPCFFREFRVKRIISYVFLLGFIDSSVRNNILVEGLLTYLFFVPAGTKCFILRT